MEYDEEVEIAKGVLAISFDVFANVGNCFVVKGLLVGECPFKDHMVEMVNCEHRLAVR